MMEEILQRRFVFMFFLDSGEFRLHLFSPEPPPKVSGFLSETSQSFAFLLDLERGSDGGHDLFEARVAAALYSPFPALNIMAGL